MTRTVIRIGGELRFVECLEFASEYAAMRFVDFECQRRRKPNPTYIPLERTQERKQ